MFTIAIIVFYLFVGIYELIPIFREGKRVRMLLIYSVLMAFAMVISVLLSLDIPVPSPMEAISGIVMTVQQWLGGK